ncbi:MAG: replication-associated recombination protein A [Betaproteobacteria bacterium AqS2]|uniref:Replication-associated recombination protein A n=1 Tax=Candidatus Amphirhobacter heronislandensis TaxID=1732024 RepID=A0A930XWC2_9GAMM|nr:replication-associated recombination protein A [Betaproteobacteria bacterium AqS2]
MASKSSTEGGRQPPWAEELRPQRLEDFVGQRHLLGEGSPLLEEGLHSMLLWGPPGCGKTTLARLLATRSGARFASLSPVVAGIKEVKERIAEAESLSNLGQEMVIFVDEVHRFNKAQQDYFLPAVEQGVFTFIGATTENPSFEINSALLSRVTVYQLRPLGDADLAALAARISEVKGLSIAPKLLELLTAYADGDARQLLNVIELLAKKGPKLDESSVKDLRRAVLRRHDKGGDSYYDQISALIKSIRGSSVDGCLYWLCRLLDGGTEPRYVTRRLIRIATEDVGLADVNALTVALNADRQYRILGSPEGELGIAMAAVYLAVAPKSNAIYNAFGKVSKLVAKGSSAEVPPHLRNAPTELMKELGYGKEYRYAHDEPHHYAANATYLPEGVGPLDAYKPTAQGFEERVGRRLEFLRSLDEAAAD